MGRQPISVCTLAFYITFHGGQAYTTDMATLPFLCGFTPVTPLTTSTCLIADMWDPMDRGDVI